MAQVYNPYLPSFEYVPDGEPHVFGGRIYIYGSHDRFGGMAFCLNDYVCYSADIKDLSRWKYEGVIYRKEQDPVNQNIPADAPAPTPDLGLICQMEQLSAGTPDFGPGADTENKNPLQSPLNPRGIHAMWAPDVVKGPDGRYYLYYCLDFLPEIGVAVCDTPAGKYEYLGRVRHEDGIPLGSREGDHIQFDPGIFLDDDGSIYLYSGNASMFRERGHCNKLSQVMRLKSDMLTLAEEPRPLLPDVFTCEGTGFEEHAFFEASSIRKLHGTYYFVYSSVNSHELCYAVSDKPDRGYRFGGTLVDIGDVYLQGRSPEHALNCLGNTHGGLECIEGQWYVFYHRQTNRTQFSRQACAEKVYFRPDGSIPQVEVTSCGLNAGPLKGWGRYPARICCQLTAKESMPLSDPRSMDGRFPYLTQDVPDFDPDEASIEADRHTPVQYIKNLRDGATAGYKYFDFCDIQTIRCFVRGNFTGEIEIFAGEQPAGRLLLRCCSAQWQACEGTVSIPNGVHALYFHFAGEGTLDFLAFEFI